MARRPHPRRGSQAAGRGRPSHPGNQPHRGGARLAGGAPDLILLARRRLRPGGTGMDNETVIRLRRVVLKLARQLNAASREEGLTPTQASVLGIATMRGPLSLAELTEIE